MSDQNRMDMMIPPLAREMVGSLFESVSELKDRIYEIRYAEIGDEGEDAIEFTLNGRRWIGTLQGRNAGLCLGFGEEQDRAIAVRCIIAGDANPKGDLR